jgi:uncharacterized protein YqgQ
MPINQLFKSIPPKFLIIEMLSLYGIDGFTDDKTFSKIELNQVETVDKMTTFIFKLRPYYLPCKQKIYLNNLNIKKIITILRQCVRLFDYKIISKEKYLKGEKIIEYQLNLIDINKNIKKNNLGIVIFD